MIGSFNFNSIESSSFSLVCKSVKRPLLPAAKTSIMELVGASGAYDFGDNEYGLRSVTMRIAYIGTSYAELRSRARLIAAWLSTATWGKLIINDETDKYYLAKISGEIDLESLYESGTAEVVFDCQPFAYSITEFVDDVDTIVPVTFEFDNPGTRVINYKSPPGSKFLITVTGSWTTLSLALNGRTLNYNTAVVAGILIIDNIQMEVTLNAASVFGNLTGDIDYFLSILPGDNTLSIGGTGLSVNVEVNFISMWM